ncbi:MAG: DegT/DnrJ/EryC1/StrS family aminotransferase [Verrucomicrobia bacterium]|nr:DegT/DnrJ/EryC1/StrS family aminotransferase [Verrucomicrobiota bacterium]
MNATRQQPTDSAKTAVAKRPVPFLALGGVWEQDDIDAATKVMQAAARPDGNFFPLPEEKDFQNALARHEGCKHAVVVNSCGTALDLCMMALGIHAGDEVIVPGLTFVCTAGAAVARSAKAVFADIDPVTLCLSPSSVEKKISPRTKAIIPVHFSGLAADIEGFDNITKRHGIPVIYDAAHAVGTRHKGKGIGGAGLAACYSFQSNKNMTTLGEGGAITSDNAEFAEKVRGLKTFGYVYGPQLRVTQIGFNYRMTKPQAATGMTQLAKIDRVIAARLARFQQMNRALEDVAEIIRPAGITEGHGCHLYVARLDTSRVRFARADFLKHLKDVWQIACGNHYPAVWSWEAFQNVNCDKSDTPVTHKAVEQVMSLPLFPSTTDEGVAYIAHAIKETIAALKKE